MGPIQTYKTKSGEEIKPESLQKMIALYHERMKKLSEVSDLIDMFLVDKLEYSKILLKWKEMTDGETKNSLKVLVNLMEKIDEKSWDVLHLENTIMPEAEKTGDRGRILWPMRAALTGKQSSAGPFEVAAVLGKKKSINRIKDAEKLF
jgi:glutamyl/glutaminyl-tRNA synthetase